MGAQRLHVGDEVPGGVVLQRGVRRRASAAALIEQNDAVARRIVKAAHGRVGAAARPAMHHHARACLADCRIPRNRSGADRTRRACRCERGGFPEIAPGGWQYACPSIRRSCGRKAYHGGHGFGALPRAARRARRACTVSPLGMRISSMISSVVLSGRGDRRLPVNARKRRDGHAKQPGGQPVDAEPGMASARRHHDVGRRRREARDHAAKRAERGEAAPPDRTSPAARRSCRRRARPPRSSCAADRCPAACAIENAATAKPIMASARDQQPSVPARRRD